MVNLESQLKATQSKLVEMESSTTGVNSYLLDMAFKILDLENRSCRSNIRLRGLPEAINNSELQNAVSTIFNQ